MSGIRLQVIGQTVEIPLQSETQHSEHVFSFTLHCKNVHDISLHVTDDGVDVARHLGFGEVFKHAHDVALREDAGGGGPGPGSLPWLHGLGRRTGNMKKSEFFIGSNPKTNLLIKHHESVTQHSKL